MSECIFCQIVAGDMPCHKIWEDDAHLAFLSPFPNTPGFSVVIPKAHHGSYIADASDDIQAALVNVACQVAKNIDATFEDVGRTGMIFEGFGVDHLHAKLFPMHGTASQTHWQEVKSNIDTYFEQYQGYISSHDCARADDAELAELAQRILQQQN